MAVQPLPVWRKCRIGRMSKEHIQDELHQGAGVTTTPQADGLLRSDDFIPTEELSEVSLVKITPADLGMTLKEQEYRISYEKVLKCGLASGLSACPFDLAPRLRVQYQDQPRGEILWVAMVPLGYVPVWSGRVQPPRVFGLNGPAREHNGYLDPGKGSLVTRAAEPDPPDGWSLTDTFLFVRSTRQIVKRRRTSRNVSL